MEAGYKSKHILHIVMEGNAKVDHENEWQTYCEMNSQLEDQRGQALSMLRGQWMQVIIDKTKHDAYWYNKS